MNKQSLIYIYPTKKLQFIQEIRSLPIENRLTEILQRPQVFLLSSPQLDEAIGGHYAH